FLSIALTILSVALTSFRRLAGSIRHFSSSFRRLGGSIHRFDDSIRLFAFSIHRFDFSILSIQTLSSPDHP
ncbi:hypothetical protein, partial [Lysinibacillus sp. FJAT-14222]|uniref:hypothetical protein n=1 Tax=Lysinibacillus sp. FJAT-14222 TaxID=1932366 RepID=UPI0019D6EE01